MIASHPPLALPEFAPYVYSIASQIPGFSTQPRPTEPTNNATLPDNAKENQSLPKLTHGKVQPTEKGLKQMDLSKAASSSGSRIADQARSSSAYLVYQWFFDLHTGQERDKPVPSCLARN
jgi:hypothetical protein